VDQRSHGHEREAAALPLKELFEVELAYDHVQFAKGDASSASLFGESVDSRGDRVQEIGVLTACAVAEDPTGETVPGRRRMNLRAIALQEAEIVAECLDEDPCPECANSNMVFRLMVL
jgi:hypothetical protein